MPGARKRERSRRERKCKAESRAGTRPCRVCQHRLRVQARLALARQILRQRGRPVRCTLAPRSGSDSEALRSGTPLCGCCGHGSARGTRAHPLHDRKLLVARFARRVHDSFDVLPHTRHRFHFGPSVKVSPLPRSQELEPPCRAHGARHGERHGERSQLSASAAAAMQGGTPLLQHLRHAPTRTLRTAWGRAVALDFFGTYVRRTAVRLVYHYSARCVPRPHLGRAPGVSEKSRCSLVPERDLEWPGLLDGHAMPYVSCFSRL